MLPADERFHADRHASREAEDWLVVEDEFAAWQGAPEPALHDRALLRLFLHLLREELEAVAARLLRAVHRGVDVGDEHLGVVAVARVEADADGRLDEQLAFLDQVGLRDDLQDLPRHRRRVGLAPDSVHEEQELVPAHARHRVIRADAAPEAVGRLHEKLVARRVSERVVDALEVVEVEEHDRERLAAPLRVEDRERKPVVEENPIRQIGERVVVRLVPALLLGAFAVGDVDEAAFHHRFAPTLGLEEALVREHPHGRAVAAFQVELEIDEHALACQPREEGLAVRGIGVEIQRGDLQDVFTRGIAEDARERGIAIENPAVESGSEEPGEIPLEEEPKPLLRRTEGVVAASAEAPTARAPRRTVMARIAATSRLRTWRVA